MRGILHAFVVFGVATGLSFGIGWAFGFEIPFGKDALIWISATAVPVLLVAAVIAVLEGKKSRKSAAIVAVIIVGVLFVALVTTLLDGIFHAIWS